MRSLTRNGYTQIPEDVILMGKREGDTLIYYQLEDLCQDPEFIDRMKIVDGDTVFYQVIHEKLCYKKLKVIYRNCQIKLPRFDSLEIVRFLDGYPDAHIISDWEMTSPKFFVRYGKNNLVYECSAWQFDSTLSISCFFPDFD